MMNEQEKNNKVLESNVDFVMLLAKRRKLLNLRAAVITRDHMDQEGDDKMKIDNPDTPLSSTTDISITPPAFSPLTPRINIKDNQGHKESMCYDISTASGTENANEINFQENQCHPVSLLTHISESHDIERNSSPIPTMSPETQKLFNVLNESGTLDDNSPYFIENSDILDVINSDDSVADPNFVPCNKDGSETECGSNDDDINNSIINIHEYTAVNENNNNIAVKSISIEQIEPVMQNTDKFVQLTPQKVVLDKESEALSPVIQIQEVGYFSPEKEHEPVIIESNDNDPISPRSDFGRPKKGRKRKHAQSASTRKFNKYNNLAYSTIREKKRIEPKTFKNFSCKCSKKCASLISEEDRKIEFQTFVTLGSYSAQLMYIKSCVKEEPKKRSYTMTTIPVEKKKPKQFHRTYTLNGVKVCRDMFLNTLQITTQKVTIALKKIRNNDVNDYRGTKGGFNKLSEEDTNFIIKVITKLPKYISHYRREEYDAQFLQPGMTVSKLYEIYKKLFIERFGPESKCASLATVKNIFLTKFNLRCKSLKKDTCNRCDTFAVKLKNATDAERSQIEANKDIHLEKAQKQRNQMNRDFETARIRSDLECLSFDLEKTLPLPRIPTNVIFYKRQLWLYNSGIHSASDDTGHCYVWIEGEAGRGAQEVGSCLIKYIETKLRPTAEHLILWSDCAGGQNRNIKIVLMLKAILSSHPKLKTIAFRYLESGHSFLPNDTDFSKIETALKNHQRVYTAEEYIHIMKTARKKKPFQVYKMERNDFHGTEQLEKSIVNRKKFIDNSKVNWLNVKEIKLEKDKMYSIFMRTSFDEEFKEINIKKKSKVETSPICKENLILLWPKGKPIAPAKLTDLQSIYHLIPQDCVDFYKQLNADENIIDDVDGFGGVPDFDPDNDNDDMIDVNV